MTATEQIAAIKANRVPIEQLHELSTFWFPVDDPLENSRKVKYLMARTMLFQVMHDEGYSMMEIERYTGWDHSSISVALRNKRTEYSEYVKGLKNFKEYIHNPK